MTKKTLDWDRVRSRLAGVQDTASSDSSAAMESKANVFRRRANLLAAPAALPHAAERQEMIMILRVGGGRYGIPLAHVTEVIDNASCAKVPGSPPHVAGVIQVRGELRPVYELSRMLGVAEEEQVEAYTVLLLRRNGREFGAHVGSVDDIRAVGPEDHLPATVEARHAAWVTKDLVSVLDIDSVWGEER